MKNNIWSKINNKYNKKSIYEISQETNIPEEKVEEIMSGERELPTERVDTFLEVIQKDDKAKRKVEIENIKQWIKETDLKEKRKELGYESQRKIANQLKINPSVICNLENKKLDHISDKFLKKYYDFMNDGLNKVIKKEVKGKIKETNYDGIYKWAKEFDIRKWLIMNDLSIKDITKEIGYTSTSTIYDAINGTRGLEASKKVLGKLYNYITNYENNKAPLEPSKTLEDEIKEIVKETKEENIISEENNTTNIYKENISIEELQNKIAKLEKQIERYEKLIDRL